MNFIEIAKKRYSVRNYSGKKVEKEKLDKILQAAHVAPTAANLQPVHLIAVESKEGLEKISKGANIYNAPLAIIVCADHNKAWVRPFDQKQTGDIDAAILILGCIMNIVQTLSFACTASVIYKKKHTLSGAVIGLASGWLITVVVMLLWNYLVTPLYMGYPREAVVELLLPAFLPFNLLKGGLNASITFLLYKPIVTALRKSGYVAASENEARQKHTGLLILASFIIVTCVLIILSMNGII